MKQSQWRYFYLILLTHSTLRYQNETLFPISSLLSFILHFLVILLYHFVLLYLLLFFFLSVFSSLFSMPYSFVSPSFLNYIFLLFLKPSLPTPSSHILPSFHLFPFYILFLLPLLFVLFSSASSSPVFLSDLSLRSPILHFLVFLLLLFLFFPSSSISSFSAWPSPSILPFLLLFLLFLFHRLLLVPLLFSLSLIPPFPLVPWPAKRLARMRCEDGQTIKQRNYVTALCHHLRVARTGTYWLFRKSFLSQREVRGLKQATTGSFQILDNALTPSDAE